MEQVEAFHQDDSVPVGSKAQSIWDRIPMRLA